MIDSSTEATDHAHTEENRKLVQAFVESVLIKGDLDRLTDFLNPQDFTDHNPRLGEGIDALQQELASTHEGQRRINYQHNHRILAEGNFVLSISEGGFEGKHTAFYDLFRVSERKLVEHWDTTEKIAPKSEWKNNNGKF